MHYFAQKLKEKITTLSQKPNHFCFLEHFRETLVDFNNFWLVISQKKILT